MRQVRTCDFCGDDATGLYEPLPPTVPGAPRMLLCDACRDRLSSVVDPLVARLEGDLDADPPGGVADRSDRTDRTDRTDGDDGGAREWPADPREGTGAESVAEHDRQSEEPAGAAGERPGDPVAGASGDRDGTGGTEVGAGDDAGDAVDAADPEAGTRTPPSAVDEPADDGGVDVSESRDASGRSQSERGGAPRGYRKVLRFLENRQLPMDRTEAERLAAEAYDLDVGEVGSAIDHAVQYGRLREVSGEIKR